MAISSSKHLLPKFTARRGTVYCTLKSMNHVSDLLCCCFSLRVYPRMNSCVQESVGLGSVSPATCLLLESIARGLRLEAGTRCWALPITVYLGGAH